MTSPDYTSIKALAFDIYGTLIDWETSIITHFQHHVGEDDPEKVPRDEVIKIFHKHERNLQTQSPTKPYRDVADEAAELTNDELFGITGVTTGGGGTAEGMNIGDWPAFPDTVRAMQRLKPRHKLIALSNIDHESFTATLSGPLKDVEFDATYIAEDIGSYKPDPGNFAYLINHAKMEFGIEKDEICMVAHGLETDHAVLPKVGMKRGVWIMRGDEERLGKQAEATGVGAKFETLGDFANAVEEAFAGGNKTAGKVGKEEGVGEALVELEERGVGGS